ncbi:hypothetical protein SAMN02746041_03304 [Desulfacinum hydrothermale DSM 13146]|uniref:Uncharacterized protein n=1 Tax=Desulfacinum hydrothermale DSM 13146 TaxID=1121390 RepID=A0A1W1XYQ8_9BACT|nr:hypothetical protein [Desulfacinum hydrothermale]SMC28691.1 hypothetical protein SAMN02746041_03304 [Desulfacinum hydrothermale DSM 13146]
MAVGDQKGRSTAERGVSIVETFLVSAIVSVVMIMVSYYVLPQHSTGDISKRKTPGIIVVDSDKLIELKLKELENRLKEDPTTDLTGEGAEFARRMNELIEQLGREGNVVLQARYALIYPSAMDRTRDLAMALGVKFQEHDNKQTGVTDGKE